MTLVRICVILVYVVILSILTIGNGKTDTIPNFHQVNPWLYRGGRPRQEGFTQLKQIGIKTIINLERELFEKEPGEVKKERNWATEANIQFYHIPMHPICAPKKEDVERATTLIIDPANQPVFVHCDRGSDRTGIVIAAYRMGYEDRTFQQAYEEMVRYGHRTIVLFWWKNLLLKF